MSKRIQQLISAFMAIVLLIGMVPSTVFAVEVPGFQVASSENESVQDIPEEGINTQSEENEVRNPMIRLMSASDGTNKMDTSYLSISVNKYGKTISATDTASNQVEVLEYTQWQMSARFVRIYDGKVEADQDVTAQCTWTSTDSSGTVLSVTEAGLVTAYGASDASYSISASYQSMVNVTTADGTSGMEEQSFTANLDFHISELKFSSDSEEMFRCLALAHLARYESSMMMNNVGKTVSQWTSEIQMKLLKNASFVACSDDTLAYLNTSSHPDKNSARVLHFLSAAAGDCVIGKYYFTLSQLETLSFARGSQKYMTLLYDFSVADDAEKAEEFLSHEADGSRRVEFIADKQYEDDQEYFQLGLEAYRNLFETGDSVTVIGEYYGGTIAKYVSYVTGCKAKTFNAPSPIQYVLRYNLPEFCKYYSIDHQMNYVFSEYRWKSPLYSIESTYSTDRKYGCALEFLQYFKDDYVATYGVTDKRNKEQRLWNRYVYLGDNAPDAYDDTGALTGMKLNHSILFGGGGIDTFTVKYAQMDTISPLMLLGELAFVEAALLVKEIQIIAWIYNVPTGTPDLLLEPSRSIIGANIVAGGPGDDIVTGCSWNNSICYYPGSGNDIYHLKGFWNRIYLIGYDDGEVLVECKKSEHDENLYVVTVDGRDTFRIDVSGCVLTNVFAPFKFYQGTPFDAKRIESDSPYIYDSIDGWEFACPVDVQILDSSGEVVLELLDGQESCIETEYGIFGVTLEGDEYVKTVVLFDNSYRVQLRGTGTGEMKVERVQWTFDAADGQYCSIDNIPVQKDAVYYPSDNLEEYILQADLNSDGTIDETITFDTTVSFAQDAYEISYGTQKRLTVDVSTSSTDRDCVWFSTDDSVVTVDEEGTLTAVGFGKAEIYAIAADGSGAYDSCKVTVPQEPLSAEKFVVTGLESTYEYTGEVIDVQLDVSYGCFPLLQDVHYTAEFSELLEPGKATLTITGINDYSGTVTLNYEIVAPEEPDTVEEKVDWIAAECRKAGITDPWDIALWLHDWLVYNANYDYTYTYYTSNGVLLEGTGVCQSYAEAYALLLNEFSIENKVLMAPEMDHAWNLVKIDGEWCHIDCTWDDPGTGGAENYTYFGMDDSLMKRDHVWNTNTYPASGSKKNYYLIRKNANVVESTQELEDFLAKMAEEQTESFVCYYIGEDRDFSIFEEFQDWYNTNDWKYGLDVYSIEGTQWMLRVTMSYTEPWDPPVDITEIVDCPVFTLRGPDGVYPMEKYSQNGVVLIFGREICGNTMALLSALHPNVSDLNSQGIQVFVNLEDTFVPSDYASVKQDYPSFTYTYYDSVVLNKLTTQVGISGFLYYPIVFVINGEGKIIACSTGYVSDIPGFLRKVVKTATNQPLPDPDPVDEDYYGSCFNYTGNDKALAKFIDKEIASGNTEIIARDGTWTDNGEDWNSDVLGTAMLTVLDKYRSDPRYDIPYGWTYYYYTQTVVINIGYLDHFEHIPQTVPGKAPTCTETGLTEGSICSVCGATIQAQDIIPLIGHKYKSSVTPPTATEKGYTTHTCSGCGDSYVDSYVDPIPQLPEAEIGFSRMILGNELTMQYAFKQADIDPDTEYVVSITKTYADGREDKVIQVPESQWKSATVSGEPYYYVSFNGIAAKEMNDAIHVQVVTVDGASAGEEFITSVSKYALDQLRKTTVAATRTLYVDMLNYGAAAQTYFKYNANDLANADLTATEKGYATKSVNLENRLVKGTGYSASQLNLASSIQLRVRFSNIDSSMYAVIRFTNHMGRQIESRVEGSEFMYSGTVVVIDDVVAADFDRDVSVKVYDANGKEIANAVESVASYLARQTDKADAPAIYDAVAKYCASAYAYLHQ